MFLVREDFRTFIKKYPIISIMVGICSLLALLTTVKGGYTTENIVRFGGYMQESVKQGDYWRLLTYAFMHGSYTHFFMNMTFLIILGRPLESALGSVKFLLFYIITAIFTGIILHLVYTSNIVSSGSSGVGYGFLGIYLYIILFRRSLLLLDDRKFIVLFIGIGLISSLIIPSSSLTGHVAGLIIGFIISPLLLNKTSTFKRSLYV